MYSLQIQQHYRENFRPGVDDVFRLRLEVVGSAGLSPKVFLYSRGPAIPGSTDPIDSYEGVCSAVDLAEYPEDNPSEDAEDLFFRLDFMELDFRSQAAALDAQKVTLQELRALLRALRAADELTVPQGSPITITDED